MDTSGWLKAAREGRIKNDWATIPWSEAGIDIEARMSTMPAMVDGQVRSIDAYTQQLVGDALAEDGESLVMPTPKFLAVRHKVAPVRVPIIAMDVVHTTGEAWGERWWQALCHATGATGQWLVSDIGKPWTVNQRSAPDASLCEGFFADSVADFHGIPCGPTEVPGVYAVRVPGAPEALGGMHRSLRQIDYSGHGAWFHPVLKVKGQDRLMREALMDPVLGPILCGKLGALPFWRHPGVPLLADAPEWKALLALGAPQPPDTLRDLPHLIDNKITPATPQEIFDALKHLMLGVPRAVWLCLLAQIALETAEGALMHNYNVGNVKGRPDGSDGSSWQFFTCGEELPLAYAQKIIALDDKKRITIEKQYVHKNDDGTFVNMASVRIVPDHPACCFQAHDSLLTGVQKHLEFLARRFPTAFARAAAGDVRGYADSLGLGGYYTAARGPYVNACERYYRMYDARLA